MEQRMTLRCWWLCFCACVCVCSGPTSISTPSLASWRRTSWTASRLWSRSSPATVSWDEAPGGKWRPPHPRDEHIPGLWPERWAAGAIFTRWDNWLWCDEWVCPRQFVCFEKKKKKKASTWKNQPTVSNKLGKTRQFPTCTNVKPHSEHFPFDWLQWCSSFARLKLNKRQMF